jgi:membrane-associated phospholipid phosphatase
VGQAVGAAARAATMNARPPAPVAAVVVTPRIALRRSRIPTLVGLASLAGFGALFALVRVGRTAAFDAALTIRIQASRNAALETLMRAVSWPGFPPQSRIIPPVLIGTLAVSGRRVDAAYQAAAWGGAAISTVLKEIMRRPRPLPPAVQVVVAPLGGTSFPSGHVLTYVMFYGFLAHLLAAHGRADPGDRAAAAALLGLIAMIGPSRVEEGHHWTTDVAASYLVGTAALLGLIELHDWRSAR